jgi:hypothetical protein
MIPRCERGGRRWSLSTVGCIFVKESKERREVSFVGLSSPLPSLRFYRSSSEHVSPIQRAIIVTIRLDAGNIIELYCCNRVFSGCRDDTRWLDAVRTKIEVFASGWVGVNELRYH